MAEISISPDFYVRHVHQNASYSNSAMFTLHIISPTFSENETRKLTVHVLLVIGLFSGVYNSIKDVPNIPHITSR